MRRNGFTLMETVVAILLLVMLYMISLAAVRGFYNYMTVQQALRTATSALYWARFQSLETNRPLRLRGGGKKWEIEKRAGGQWEWLKQIDFARGINTVVHSDPVFYPQGNVSPTSTIDLTVKGRSYRITLAITGRIRVEKVKGAG